MHNRPHGFDIFKVNIKTIRTIAHIFVVVSEKLNFKNELYVNKVHFLVIKWTSYDWSKIQAILT